MNKEDKLQIKVDVFTGRAIGWYNYDKEQIIGFVMLEFLLFYDKAKEMVEKSLKSIKRI